MKKVLFLLAALAYAGLGSAQSIEADTLPALPPHVYCEITAHHLPTHRNHSYDVHRYKLNTSVEVATQGKCHVLNLVEGESAEVETAGGSRFRLSYAETLVISAAAGSYRIVNSSGREIMVVKSFMK